MATTLFGKEIVDLCLDIVRKLRYNCMELQGFLVYNDIRDEMRFRLNLLLLESFLVDYKKKTKMKFTI